MTDKELAQALFPPQQSSMSSASLLIGTVISTTPGGRVIVDVGGSTVGGSGSGVEMSTTVACAEGDRVVITLYGRQGQGKKGIITGVIL